ncbi:hypothetical protein CS022_20510 [Veronia nyctiphanis]|uniref:Uncharacterized protein n=1 Tax=Veronia nyctiphanis TaxID=1278244 RepID=A0A4Q0YR43_9GAMM|nr:hypothetical protein [Veronia nyctiphanis]RXJ71589.1 hypothetical protein CS022_20510 [Veronia nyctiphanis]
MEENRLRSAAFCDSDNQLSNGMSNNVLSVEKHFKSDFKTNRSSTISKSDINLILNFSHLFALDSEKKDYLEIKDKCLSGKLLTQYECDRLADYDSKIATFELDLALLQLPKHERAKYLLESTELLHFEDDERHEYVAESRAHSSRFDQTSIKQFGLEYVQRYRELTENVQRAEETALLALRERASNDAQLYQRLQVNV